jgi:hypothetical protein
MPSTASGKSALPPRAGPAGYLTSSEDGRTFVDEFHPKEGEIAVDVYVEGKPVASVGPYIQYQGQDVKVGSNGSLALLIWKDQQKKVAKAVAVGPDGKERFRADCDGPVISPQPALDGTAVLVQTNAGGRGSEHVHVLQQIGERFITERRATCSLPGVAAGNHAGPFRDKHRACFPFASDRLEKWEAALGIG